MAEGFVCGRGRGSKLGPLELFVDGNVNEKLSTYGTTAVAEKRATIGKTLRASVPIGVARSQTGFTAKGIILDNVYAIELVVSNITHENPVGGGANKADIFVAIYDPEDSSSPLISSYIYAYPNYRYPLVRNLNLEAKDITVGKEYDFSLIATSDGEDPSTNYGPTIEVSRISLLPR